MRIRLTKYNPVFRRQDGSYTRNEWTSYSDIGKEFVDGVLTLRLYLDVEHRYVTAICDFFECASVSTLVIEEFEWSKEKLDGSPTDISQSRFEVGSLLNLEELGDVVRICLREEAWCKLKGEHSSYVHFGYDFYTYLGADHASIQNWLPPDGMFAEYQTSPYGDR